MAKDLGEDEDWLRDIALGMEIEDGMIWVVVSRVVWIAFYGRTPSVLFGFYTGQIWRKSNFQVGRCGYDKPRIVPWREAKMRFEQPCHVTLIRKPAASGNL